MKNLKLILLSITLCSSVTVAPAQESTQTSPQKRMLIGAGVSTYIISNQGIGANLKYDYLFTNKLSIGLKAFITTNGAKDYTSPSDQWGAGYSADYQPGNSLNLMIASSFYFLGENSNESKGGVYGILGAGYSASKMSETITSMAAVSDPAHYMYSRNTGGNNLSGMAGVGGHLKLGPGKIYLEVPFILDIYGKSFTKYIDQQRNGGIDQPNVERVQFQGFYPSVFLNFGYQIYF